MKANGFETQITRSKIVVMNNDDRIVFVNDFDYDWWIVARW